MTDRPEEQDPYSGLRWVYVTRAEVFGHPKGRLNAILWGIVVFLIGTGLLKLWVFASAGAPLAMVLLSGLLPILTGLGLAVRAPLALVAAIVMAGVTLYSTMRAMGEGQSIVILMDAVLAFGIIFYLLDGDRPNFIYRHRFRKYSDARED